MAVVTPSLAIDLSRDSLHTGSGGKLRDLIAIPHPGATVTPSKEELETKARHFANTVFAIGAGVIMLIASLLQSFAVGKFGANGGDYAFIAATLGIFVLASKRARFALFALERQCAKYGHTPREGTSVCSRCFHTIPDPKTPD